MIFIVFIYFSVLNGCKKDSLTHPVKVTFSINLEQIKGLPAYITSSQSVVSIGSISFLGLRQQGGDVHFDTKPGTTQGTYILSSGKSAEYVTYFDIPQGVYDYMNWSIILNEIDEETYDNTLVDSEDYGLLISGIYTKLDGAKIPFYFMIDPLHKFSFEASDIKGSTPMSIIDGQMYDILIELGPSEAILNINRDYFEKATIESDDDNEYIIISPESNINFYQYFLFQLEKTRRATVN